MDKALIELDWLKYYMNHFISNRVANETVAKFSPHEIKSFEDFKKVQRHDNGNPFVDSLEYHIDKNLKIK